MESRPVPILRLRIRENDDPSKSLPGRVAIGRRGRSGHIDDRYNAPVRIVSSAPTRIDLAGGTIDIWPLYLFHDGALTLNAAISLRADAELESRDDGRVELRSIDTGRTASATRSADLDVDGDLSLLALLCKHYQLENATLTTRGKSPAGAGIAGSSALAMAVTGGL